MCKPKKEPIPWLDPIPAKILIQATPTPTPLVVVPVPEPDPAKTGFVTPLEQRQLKKEARHGKGRRLYISPPQDTVALYMLWNGIVDKLCEPLINNTRDILTVMICIVPGDQFLTEGERKTKCIHDITIGF